MKSSPKKAPRVVQFLSTRQLKPNPWNRTQFDPEALKELAKSIRAEGIREPLLVRQMAQNISAQRKANSGELKAIRSGLLAAPSSASSPRGDMIDGTAPSYPLAPRAYKEGGAARSALPLSMYPPQDGRTPDVWRPGPTTGRDDVKYEIASGNRRWLAAQKVGLKKVPCLIEELSDEQVAEDNITMNIQREDIPPLELARMIQEYMKKFDRSQADACRAFGKSRAWVSRLLGFLKFPAPALKVFSALNMGWPALEAIRTLSPDLTTRIAQELKDGTLNPRRIVKRCNQFLYGSHSKGGFHAENLPPDPFLKEWEKVNDAMLAASSVWWDVRYSQRKLPNGEKALGWDFFVKPQLKVSKEALAEWFMQMGKALAGKKLEDFGAREMAELQQMEAKATTNLGNEETPGTRLPSRPLHSSPKASSIDGTAPADKSPIWGTNKARVPRTAAEKAELLALAVRGTPKDVYAWIFGAGSVMMQMMPYATWKDMGSSPQEGLKRILRDLSSLDSSNISR